MKKSKIISNKLISTGNKIADIAEYLDMSQNGMWAAVNTGSLPPKKILRLAEFLKISIEDLVLFLADETPSSLVSSKSVSQSSQFASQFLRTAENPYDMLCRLFEVRNDFFDMLDEFRNSKKSWQNNPSSRRK